MLPVDESLALPPIEGDPRPLGALPLAALQGAAELLTRYPFPIWHYGDSVGFEGLLAASELLGDGSFAGWVHGAIKGWIPRARPFRELDNTAPGHAICQCVERTNDATIVDTAADLARFLAARRTIAGAFVSFESAPLREPYGGVRLDEAGRALLADPGPGVFIDCLHFDPPFMLHAGRLAGDAALRRAGAEQALALIELLQDNDGLFHHFYLERSGERYGYGWSRGQGWALLGLVDVLAELDADDPARAPISRALERLVDALLRTQRRSGHWGALCQVPAAAPETSAALFAATGLLRAIRLGLLDPDVEVAADTALAAGIGALDVHGRLRGVSAAVWASTALDHYLHVPIGLQVPWGQGPLLLAALESRKAA